MNIEIALREFLAETGGLDIGHMGPGEAKTVAPEAGARLRTRLLEKDRLNDRMIVVILCLLVALFGLGAFLGIKHSDSTAALSSVFGGTFLSMLVILRFLRQLWRERLLIMLFADDILENLSPEEAVKVIQSFYYREGRGRGVSAPAPLQAVPGGAAVQ